ncbi:MAG: hypothetical protein ACRD6I_20035, partial [Candidatus Acidiferrales bacterium]
MIAAAGQVEGAGLAAASDRRFFAELMVELERRMDVNALQFDSLLLWPLVRWRLAGGIKSVKSGSAIARRDQVRARLEKIAEEVDLKAKVAHARRASAWERAAQIFGKLLQRPGGLRDTVSDADSRFAAALRADLARQFDALRAIGPVDFVVFSKTEKYYQRVGEKRYAP